MKTAQQKLWDSVDMAADGTGALALLQSAIRDGANLSDKNDEGHDPLRATVEVCCQGKEPFARELAMLGCNPLNGALAWAIGEEDYEISEALIDASLQKSYTSETGQGVLEVILRSLPVTGLDDLVRYALDQGADPAPPEGKDWFMVLLGNPQAFDGTLDQSSDPILLDQNQSAWRVFEALLDRGFMPTVVDEQGHNRTIELFNDRLMQGSQTPENQSLIARFLKGNLDNGTAASPTTEASAPKPLRM